MRSRIMTSITVRVEGRGQVRVNTMWGLGRGETTQTLDIVHRAGKTRGDDDCEDGSCWGHFLLNL